MEKTMTGKAVVNGIAIGKAKVLSRSMDEYIKVYQPGAAVDEEVRFKTAVENVGADLTALVEAAKANNEDSKAAIMEAHLMMLEDPSLAEKVKELIYGGNYAPQAILTASEEIATMLAALDDAYLRERAADVRDVGKRIARKILGVPEMQFGDEPVILVATEIEPSLMASVPLDKVQGVALVQGSTTCHAIIIAKARDLVAVVGLPENILEIKDDTSLIIDGFAGEMLIEPSEEMLESYREKLEAERAKKRRYMELVALPAITKDERKVQLAGNIGTPSDMDVILKYGAQGVGLFRTEFLFMGKTEPPSEEEQFNAYREAAEKCGEHLCVIRTMDIGGDKPLPYLQVDHEENPFLGCRAIRLCFKHKDIFLTQLKAILRAGAYGKVAIMLPMVISVTEIRKAKEFLREAKEELLREGKKFDSNIPVGIMVETPAAAANADGLASECDFFSIGTNDLAQYTLAVDRMNPAISDLYDHFNPAVLKLIHRTIEEGRKRHIWVGMCGEMASDPLAAALLIGMGIDELSMNGPAVPRVKEMVRSIEAKKMEQIVQQVLLLDDGDTIRNFLRQNLEMMK